jgi:hypothetical protein
MSSQAAAANGNRKRATQLRMTLRLESIYGVLLVYGVRIYTGHPVFHGRFHFDPITLCIGGCAGYDSLLGGF